MIRLNDAWTLAATKLRTRKTRTIVTATLASLLFAVLVFAFTIAHGAFKSYERFSKDGLSNRYITDVRIVNQGYADYSSAELIAKAKLRHKEIIEQKKADAKRLGLIYDSSQDPAPTIKGVEGEGESLNTESLAARQILKELQASKKSSAEKVREMAAQYKPVGQFVFEPAGDVQGLTAMRDGKEPTREEKNQMYGYFGQENVVNVGYLPKAIVDSFIIEGADISRMTDPNTSIPVIAPYRQIEQALGLKSLTKNASSSERLSRMDMVKNKAVNVSIPVCYRNQASLQMIEQAKNQISEMEKHKNDKIFLQPSVQYALPDRTNCGPVVTVKDTRTNDEKRYAERQLEFDIKYEFTQKPTEKKIIFRVVGISPDMPDFTNIGTIETLGMIIGGSSLRGQWVVPLEMVDSAIREQIIPQVSGGTLSTENMFSYMGTGDLVEFSNAEDAERFVTEQGCTGMDCMSKPTITYFGSSSVLIKNAIKMTTKALSIAALVIAVLAAFLMMGMIGRVITDSRRETAVFRAIGAKRNDIRAIYLLYVISFSLIVSVLAMLIGTGAAAIISTQNSEAFTTSARLMFIQSRETAPFSLMGIWPEALSLTVGIIVLTGFIAMLLPLARNLARNPLKDMRDE